MTVRANSYQRVDIIHNLEDVRDVIYDVSPEETPLMTNAPQGTCENTLHEWHTDELDAPDTTNARIDGEDFAGAPITSTVRLTNECQISRKDFIVTRRARRVNKAGERDELARQVVRKGRELKRDMESIMLSHQARRTDNGAQAPLLASLPTWITLSDRPAGGGNPVGDGSNVPTPGTSSRALDEKGLLDVVKLIFDESQELPNVLMLDTASKQNFSKYMFTADARIATQYQDQQRNPRGGVQVVGAVDTWVTDYAVLDVVPNRFIPVNNTDRYDAFIYHTDWIDVCYFDPISTDAMAKVADADDRMVLADYTLVPRNPKTIGVFADIDNTTDMVAG